MGQIKRARSYMDVQAAKDAYDKFRTQVLEEATKLQQRVVVNTNETLYAEWQLDTCGALNRLPQPEKKARFCNTCYLQGVDRGRKCPNEINHPVYMP